jgi:hypothetical protein
MKIMNNTNLECRMANTIEFFTRTSAADSQLRQDELPMLLDAHV